MARGAADDPRRAVRQPHLVVQRCRLRAGEVPGDLGRISRRRQEAEGQAAALRPDPGARLRRRPRLLVSLSVVVGRQGGRGRRQDRRAEQQGDRSSWSNSRSRSGRMLRRRRPLLGRRRQQPRLSVQHDQLDQQRRLDLSLGQDQGRHLPDRGRQAAKDDIFHAPLPKGPGGQFSYHVPFSNIVPAYTQEPEGGEGLPALVPRRKTSTSNGSPRSRAFRSAPPRCGSRTRCGRKTRSWRRSAPPRRAAALPAMPGPPAGPPPRSSPNSSSSTCTPRPSRACPPRTRSNAAHAELVKIYNT